MTSGSRTANFAHPGVRLVRETVTAIDPEARRVTTDAGVHEADVLVVALGADYDIAGTPGLADGAKSSTPSTARNASRACCRRSRAGA